MIMSVGRRVNVGVRARVCTWRSSPVAPSPQIWLWLSVLAGGDMRMHSQTKPGTVWHPDDPDSQLIPRDTRASLLRNYKESAHREKRIRQSRCGKRDALKKRRVRRKLQQHSHVSRAQYNIQFAGCYTNNTLIPTLFCFRAGHSASL